MKNQNQPMTKPFWLVATGALALAGMTTLVDATPVHAATLPPARVTPANQANPGTLVATQPASEEPGPAAVTDQQAVDRYQRQLAVANSEAQQALSAAASSYSQAVVAQSRANQAAIDQQAAANRLAWQQATPGMNGQNQDVARQQATRDQDQALSQADQTYQRGLASASTTQNQAEQAARAARNQALDSLAQTTQAATVVPATGISQANALSSNGQAHLVAQPAAKYPWLYLGRYQTVEANWFNNVATRAARVSQENQLPLNFRPGLLIYDASHDTSSRIAATGLTAAQKLILNELSNQWMNSLRDYYYHVLRGNLMEGNLEARYNADGTVQPATLRTEQDVWNVTQDLARVRENEHWTYDHTTTAYGNLNYYDVLRQALGLPDTWCAENLYTLAGGTMLQFEVNLYNRMQAMLYNELEQTGNGQFTDSVGHLQNALNPEFSEVAMGFQRVNNVNGQVAYDVIWEFMGTPAGNGLDTIANQLAGGRRTVVTPVSQRQSMGGFTPTTVVSQIQARQMGTPGAHDQLVAQQQKIEQNYQASVQRARANYQAQVNQLQQALQNQQVAIKQHYAQRLAELNDRNSANQQLRAQLAAKLKAVESQGDAKLADLQRQYEAQYAAIKHNLQLKQAQLADALAATRAGNQAANQETPSADSNRPEVMTHQNQVVLPNGNQQAGVTVVTLPAPAMKMQQGAALSSAPTTQVTSATQVETPTAAADMLDQGATPTIKASQVAMQPRATTVQRLTGTNQVTLGARSADRTAPAAPAHRLPQTGNRSSAVLSLVGLGLVSLSLQWALGKRADRH